MIRINLVVVVCDFPHGDGVALTAGTQSEFVKVVPDKRIVKIIGNHFFNLGEV